MLRRLILLALGAGLATITAGAKAATESTPGSLRFADDGAPAPRDDAYRPRLDRDGSAWEAWEWTFRFSSGYTVLARFTISSTLIGRHRGFVVGIVIGPAGRQFLIKNGRGRGDWTFEPAAPPATGGTVRLARHVLTFGPERHELLLHNSRGRLVLEAERFVPPFRPGRVDLGRGRFYDLTVPAPRLTARARFTPPGEAEIDLGEGAGLCVRAYSNTPDHNATAWFRLHTFDRELQLSLLEMTGSREQGYAHAGVLWVTRGRELLVRTSDPLRHFQDLQADAIGPFYPVPRSLRLSSAAAGLSGEAALRLVRRDDLLDWVDNALVRLLLGRAAHPVQYVFDTDYVFDITHGGRRERQSGTGVALFTLPGAPPKAEPW